MTNPEIQQVLGDKNNINWPTAVAYVGCAWAAAWGFVSFMSLLLH